MPPHALDGAFARVGRAEEHLADVFGEVAAFVASQQNSTFVDYKPTGPQKLVLNFPDDVPPPRLSILIGETIYNLRAALDYLVYALVAHDSGQPKAGTQFPIVDTPDEFERRKKTWLNGVNLAHITQIERLQPYKGCDWTRLLRDISNPDKHRYLVVTRGQLRGVQISLASGPDALREMTGSITSTHDPETGEDVYVKLQVTFRVSFADGTPVMALQTLQSQVAQALQEFKPDF
jgi:hypothetical protein